MLTIKDLYDACARWKSLRKSASPIKKKKGDTRFDIARRARGGIRIANRRIIEDEDEDGDIYRKVTCTATDPNGSGRPNTLEMLFYGPGDDMNTRAAANCSCEFYMYACEVALMDKGSSRIEEPIEMRIWSNGDGYSADGPNPRAIPIVCKHIYAALLQGAAAWPPSGTIRREQQRRKEKEAEEREAKRKDQKEKEKARREKEQERRSLTKPKKTEPTKKEPIRNIKTPPAPKKPPTLKRPPRPGEK